MCYASRCIADALAQAQHFGIEHSLHILDARWLLDSVALWERLPEEDYSVAEDWWGGDQLLLE